MLQAQSIYTIHIPDSGAPATFELDVTYSSTDAVLNHTAAREFTVPAGSLYTAPAISAGDWEVTVAFDLAHCGIYCAYRRKGNASDRTPLIDLLPPPITVIHVYRGAAAKPAIVFVDPAGLRLPAASSYIAVIRETVFIPGRRIFPTAFVSESGDKSPALPQSRLLSLTHSPEQTTPATISLRI
jgi:hypothetical protein